ncbi:MAG: putative transposase [Glaciecola sp.]
MQKNGQHLKTTLSKHYSEQVLYDSAIMAKLNNTMSTTELDNTQYDVIFRVGTQIISHAVWLDHLFTLNFRDIEELLAARCIVFSYETIDQCSSKHRSSYCKQITRTA